MKTIKDMPERNRPHEELREKSNRKLIENFEAKIKAKLDEIWGGHDEN